MPKSLVDVYPTLWHYTTSSGLYGILKSQQLWATNYRYLNDEEELRGFFDRKLPLLMKAGIEDGVRELAKTPQGQALIKRVGSAEQYGEGYYEALFNALRTVTLDLDVYVTSFCSTAPGLDSQDGLLSQWRGYGPDGGYALVFDTRGLQDLLVREVNRYTYPALKFSDVDYHDDQLVATNGKHEETVAWEKSVHDIVSTSVAKQNLQDMSDQLFEPIVSLCTRHKHRGFREECEVRIAAVLPNKEMIEADKKAGRSIVEKPLSFFPRNGVLVPYVTLFEGMADQGPILPIREIVVGPHPEKLKRQKAVQLFLEQMGIDATVRVSDIPYLGR